MGLLWGSMACAGGLPEPTAADVLVARRDAPEVTLEDLQRGRAMYSRRCASCHALKEPSSLAPDDWAAAVEKMRAKQGVRLSDEEAKDIVRYLSTASRVVRGASS
jgi:mono/diheme cytochrome c family protein